MARRGMDEVELQIMRLLREAAHVSGGWRRGHVRGWILGHEVSEGTGCPGASDALQRMRELAWVQSEVVRDPGRPTRPMLLWRITQLGEDSLAARDAQDAVGLPRPRTSPADEGMFFLSRQAWACLSVLQRSPRALRSTDLCAEARRRFHVWIYPNDIQMLLRRNFAEREDRGSGKETETWLAATVMGRSIRLADGRSSSSLVQLELPAGARGTRDV